MKLEVPYHSQFLDVADQYWIPRACGFSCMKMVFDFYGIHKGEIEDLAKEALETGGYGPSGLVHDYIVAQFKKAGLTSHREEGMTDGDGVADIVLALKAGNPVTLSAEKLILGQHKFHMVVLTGVKEKEGEVGELEGFYFHDPESLSHEKGKHIFVTLHDFLLSWRRKAIFVSRE